MTLLPAKREETQADYLEALSALQVLLSVGIAMLVLVAYFILKLIGCTAYWLPWFPVMGFLLSFYFLQEYLKKLCFATKRTHVPLLMDGAVFGFLLPMLALLHFRGNLSLDHALTALLFAYAASAGLGARLIGLSLIKHWKLPQLIRTAKEHYHYSFWLLGTSLVQWFSGNYFLVAAAATLGAVAVGALRMAQNMVGLCHVLFLAMENIVPTEAARQFFTAGDKAMFAYLRRVGLLGGIPVGLLLSGLTLTAPWLIGWLYGADYQEFAYLVGAYAVVYALGYIATLQRFALRSMQFTSPIFIAYTLSAVASVLVAHPIVKYLGIGGVVAGLIGAQVLMLLVYGFFIWKKHQTAHLSAAHPLSPSHSIRK